MTIDPRIPTKPGRVTSGSHRPGRHFLAPSAKRREVLGESHEGWGVFYQEPLFEADFLAYG